MPTKQKYFLISEEELNNATIAMAEDDEDYEAEQFYKRIADRKSKIDGVIEMVDRMISKAETPSHLDDLNCIIDELEEAAP